MHYVEFVKSKRRVYLNLNSKKLSFLVCKQILNMVIIIIIIVIKFQFKLTPKIQREIVDVIDRS